MDQTLLKSTQTFLGPPRADHDGLQSPLGSPSSLQTLGRQTSFQTPKHHVFLFFSLADWRFGHTLSSFIWPSNAAFLHRADRLQFDQMPYKTQMLWVVFSECFLVSPSPVSPPFSPFPLTAIHLVVAFVTVFSAQLSTNFSAPFDDTHFHATNNGAHNVPHWGPPVLRRWHLGRL